MMQYPIIDDPLNPVHAIDFATIERQAAAEAWLQAQEAPNKRVAAAAFDRSRMAKCWVPRTRKTHSRAAKAEASTRRFLAYFTKRNNLDSVIAAAMAAGATAVSVDESDRVTVPA